MDVISILTTLEQALPGSKGWFSGVYQIRNQVNGKMYIGCTVNFRWSLLKHLRDLRFGHHHSQKLQRAWWKYGEGAFIVEILDVCPDLTQLLKKEQEWLDKTQAYEKNIGYNICREARNRLGVACSLETRSRISAALRGRKVAPDVLAAMRLRPGRKQSEITKQKIRLTSMGRRHTPESKAKIGAIHRGKIVSEETRQKISQANQGMQTWLGRNHSDETKKKLSEIQSNRVYTEEQRHRIRERNKRIHTGKTVSLETREKISAAKKGHFVSEETKEKLREAWKKRKERITH